MSFIHSSTSFILHHISHFPYSHTISQSKFASVEFKALSEKDKAKWEKLAAADKERYLAEMETYSPPAGYWMIIIQDWVFSLSPIFKTLVILFRRTLYLFACDPSSITYSYYHYYWKCICCWKNNAESLHRFLMCRYLIQYLTRQFLSPQTYVLRIHVVTSL